MTDVRHDLALQTLSLPISSRFVAFNPNKNENKKKVVENKTRGRRRSSFFGCYFSLKDDNPRKNLFVIKLSQTLYL